MGVPIWHRTAAVDGVSGHRRHHHGGRGERDEEAETGHASRGSGQWILLQMREEATWGVPACDAHRCHQANRVAAGLVQPLPTTRGVSQLKLSPSMLANARSSPFGSTETRSSRPSPLRSAKRTRAGSNQPLPTTRAAPQPKLSPSMLANARSSPFGSTETRSSRPSPLRSAKRTRAGSNQPLPTTRAAPQPKFSPSMLANARSSPFGSTETRSSRPSPLRSAKRTRAGSNQPLPTTRGVSQLKLSPSMLAKARSSPFGSTETRSSRPSPDSEAPEPPRASAARPASEPLNTSWSPGRLPASAYCQSVQVLQPAGRVPGEAAYLAMKSGFSPNEASLPVHGVHQLTLV